MNRCARCGRLTRWAWLAYCDRCEVAVRESDTQHYQDIMERTSLLLVNTQPRLAAQLLAGFAKEKAS